MVNKIQGSSFFAHRIVSLVVVFHFNFYALGETERKSSDQITPSVVNIAVIRYLNSPFDSMIGLCMEMAKTDFYSAHPNYKTRMGLRTKDVEDALDAGLAVRELLEHEQVYGILAHHEPAHETFIAELGRNSQVPIISFAARSADLSDNTENQYFIRTGLEDALQALALTAICQGYQWNKVVVLYEDTKYGLQFLSHLTRAFQDVGIRLAHQISIPASASETLLHNELSVLNENQTIKVFVVHVNPSLGSRLFACAQEIGMMREEHAWIITDSLSNFINSMDIDTRESMEGVVGIRPYVPNTKNLEKFKERWKLSSSITKTRKMDLNIYGLWAYDTVTALAIAIEKSGPLNSSSSSAKTMKNMKLTISAFGPQLRKKMSNTSIKGLSGDFELVNGIRKPSAFEIINVFGSGERRLGFWTPDRGITRDLNSNSIKELKKIVWPGDSVTQPKGWLIPPTGPLRVGVPGNLGYTEFVNVTIIDHSTNVSNITGFAIDIFLAALKVMPFPIDYTFICYNGTDDGNANWTYDDMIQGIPSKKFDMIVGDTTILSSRAEYVDFSLPYAESVVALLVNNAKPFDMWTFTKPLSLDLWLAMLASCVVMGIVIWILERRVTCSDNAEPRRMMCLTPIEVLAFHERNMVSNKWSLFLLVCWLFMAYILMQSFTANLSAILAVDQLINASPFEYRSIGYQHGSFIHKYLTENLNISASNLKSFATHQEFHAAMRSGSIQAVIDEIPYMKILVNRYDSMYKIVGQLRRTEGLGFAFPVGSPLAPYFSRAIVNVTQGPEMTYIEQKNFGPGYSSQDPLSSSLSQGTSSLSFHQFAGLFIIVGSATVFAIVCSEAAIFLRRSRGVTRRSFRVHADGRIGDHVVGNANHDASRGENGDERENGVQGPRPEGDREEIVEAALNNVAADDVRDVGGEINN